MTINLNKITKITIALVVTLSLANLIATNVLATGGHELEDISMQTAQLQKENLYLKNQISQHTSLSTIESIARDRGFEEISHTLAVSSSTPVAYVAQ